MAYSQPSVTNVFVPEFTQQLIVDYSRNPKDFLVNMLATVTPVDKPLGNFMRVKPDVQARVKGVEHSMWADGTACPVQLDNMSDFEFDTWNTQRKQRNGPIGYQMAKNAVWDVKAQLSNTLANQLMTLRGDKFYSLLRDSNNYLSGHIDTAANWGGGAWSTSTTSQRYIQRAFMKVLRQLDKSTVNGGPAPDEVFFVCGPDVADLMARSPEIADYIKETTDATKYLEFKLWHDQNLRYGLPQVLYGINIVVDRTVKDSALIGETSNKTYLPGDTTAFFVTKKGGFKNASPIATDFSSVHFFVNKDWEMKTEVFDFPFDGREVVRVSDDWDAKLVAKEVTAAVTAIS